MNTKYLNKEKYFRPLDQKQLQDLQNAYLPIKLQKNEYQIETSNEKSRTQTNFMYKRKKNKAESIISQETSKIRKPLIISCEDND